MRRVLFFSIAIVLGCQGGPGPGRTGVDSGQPDSGSLGAGVDAGPDAGVAGQEAGTDAGVAGQDAGPGDAGASDAGVGSLADAGASDAGVGSLADAGSPDAGSPDAGPHPWPPPSRAGYLNPIPAENALAGDPSWLQGFTSSYAHQIEGYANRVSAAAGESVDVMLNVDSAHDATWQLYRLGWYGGAGARKLSEGAVQVSPQAACPEDVTTGLIRCAWAKALTVTIPPDAVSGLFVVRVVRSDNYGALVPVVVRDTRPADLYFQSSVSTWQAYNKWGGESLYDDDDNLPGHKGTVVSFDRPYQGDFGAGHLLRWEIFMARFLERTGYDVSYTTNLDVSREGQAALVRRGAFLSVGHDEYWTGAERDAVEGARDAGVPLYFFGANAAYWKIRTSAPGGDGNPRVISCYKQHPELDPMAGTPDRTGRFRDANIGRPEESLVGTMYEGWMLFGHPWVVAGAQHPLFEGTGLQDGDTLPQLVGYEYDRTFVGGTPGPATVVSRSPVVDAEGRPGFSEATVYTAPSGALVFGAGSIYWSLGVSGPSRDVRVMRMTANLFLLGLRLPVPAALLGQTAPAAPAGDPVWATDVRTLASGMSGAAGVAQLPDGTSLVADARAHRIWRIDAGGAVHPFAGDGNGSGSASYDNVPGLRARFYQPTALVADAAGNVYVSDTHNCVIRKIANDANRTTTTLAGTLTACEYADGTGAAARFNTPMGLAWQDATHLLVADSANQALRVVDVQSGVVTTLAITHGGDEADGPAATATFYFPSAVARAGDGRVFFLASSTGKLKVIGTDPARTITTLTQGGLGFADGAGTSARLLAQGGLVWDGTALLVADAGNQRLRRITPGATADTTQVHTWAGSGKVGAADGPARDATFSLPLGLFRAGDGTVLVADGAFGTLRAVRP